MKQRRYVMSFVILLAAFSINAQTLIIEITNIRNNKGKIVVAVINVMRELKK